MGVNRRLKKTKNKICMFLIVLTLFIFPFFVYFSASADGANSLTINPVSKNVDSDDIFTISINCTPVEPVKGFELRISFNPTLITAINITEGDFFGGFNKMFNPGNIDNSKGLITNIYGLVIGPGNTSAPLKSLRKARPPRPIPP